jgi:hypothetical protein
MSLDNIQESYFGCAETPLWTPDGFDINRVPPCKSCVLRLSAPISGSGNISPRTEGLLVDENPTATLSINGIQHNLVESVLMIGGAHRLPGRVEPCKAELACYFQNTKNFTVQVCLSFPIDIGTGDANTYFKTLGSGVGQGRAKLESIVPRRAQFLNYRGADLRGRSARNTVPSKFCDPVARITTFYVCLVPIFMANSDYQRLVGRAGKGLVGPPKPLTPTVNSRLIELGTRVEGIMLGAPGAVKSAGGGSLGVADGIPTNAMKCYRLDPDRDIKNNKVYVGGMPSTKLSSELKEEESRAGLLPGDLQKIIAGSLGLILSIILAAFVTVWTYGSIFTNYKEAQLLYKNPVSASALVDKFLPSLPTIAIGDLQYSKPPPLHSAHIQITLPK